MTPRAARSPAEWVTFAICCTILAGVVALIAVQASRTQDPAAPSAAIVSAPHQVGDSYLVEVSVTNDGDATAANVQVSASLATPDSATPATGDQTIAFLAGHEQDDLVFVFPTDPATGDLTVSVTSFAVP